MHILVGLILAGLPHSISQSGGSPIGRISLIGGAKCPSASYYGLHHRHLQLI